MSIRKEGWEHFSSQWKELVCHHAYFIIAEALRSPDT